MIDLSILICSTHTRYKTFGRAIQDQIFEQYAALNSDDQSRVEVIMLTDTKTMMLGHKRNVMVDMAQGTFVAFVDDDDRLDPDYLNELLEYAGSTDAACITFLASVSLNGLPPKICRYSTSFAADANTDSGYERLPNHICAVRREIARQVSFPNIAYGEDSAYSKLLLPLLHSEIHIPRVLYHYDYNSATTEAQQHLRAPLRQRGEPPIVDVVILSHARTNELAQMTQQAIDTAIAGANSLAVNVIVMEQWPGQRYEHATTLPAAAPFHYNVFANAAARTGSAPWIMIANNDLIFHDGWLHQLLAANHPAVSPRCPRDPRQAHITENTTGYDNAVHFSGWCFMIRRELWELMGGFDECVKFWFSDDVVIEQLRALNIEPMMVPAAIVEHLQSVTLRQGPTAVQDHLTWEQVEIFNTKYGRDKFVTDPRYQAWRARQQVS